MDFEIEINPRGYLDCPVVIYIYMYVKQIYWYISQISGERLQDHWSSGLNNSWTSKNPYLEISV